MILINTAASIMDDPIYTAECPYCKQRLLVYLYPKCICPYCCTDIPDILGITNTIMAKTCYYFGEKGVK